MGASGWAYFVPYQSDLKKAFFELRQQIFDSGKYWLVDPMLPDTEDEYIEMWQRVGLITKDDEEEARHREIYRMLAERYSKGRPTTIDELKAWNAEAGTHSIMDMEYFSDDPECTDWLTVIPLSDEQLNKVFGTTRPTHEMVVDKSKELQVLRRGQMGSYLIVYEGDGPTEIYFTGFSGD